MAQAKRVLKVRVSLAWESVAVVVIVAILLSFAIACFEAWFVMVLLGALASMTGWGCAIGFWPTYVIVVIASFLFAGGLGHSGR